MLSCYFFLGKLLNFKLFGPNHSTNDCFAYKRSYLENNSYDPEKDKRFTGQIRLPNAPL